MRLRMFPILVIACALFALPAFAELAQEKVAFKHNWGEPGLTVVSETPTGLELTFSLPYVLFDEVNTGREVLTKVSMPGSFLGNNQGSPDLPAVCRYIAFPRGASVEVDVSQSRSKVFKNMDVLPAPPIPKETDKFEPVYLKDPAIYSVDAPFPGKPVIQSEPKRMRGVDIALLSVTPFAYNPIQKELTVYTDIRIRVSFNGGAGHFGEDRLRSRWFEPLLKQHLLNYSSLPPVDFNARRAAKDEECEYMIFIPNDPAFQTWAEVIQDFRIKQGITTNIFNIADYGGTAGGMELKIDDAYNNWATPPVAVLLLGDVPAMPTKTYNGFVLSDNVIADVNSDHLPDVNMARITARDATELERTINKFIDYEVTPPTSTNFYDEPIIAGGWQSDRWFIICCDVIWGFLANAEGKSPVREYAGYGAGAPTSWSTNSNTPTIINYFGPTGLGYIPTTPSHLTDWGANAARINADINSGAFWLLHRDHGSPTGWGDPPYSISDLSALTNDDLTFVLSINCSSGDYEYSPESFAEAFHRMQYGALGVIAASDTSYSFVNDTFVWGMHDSMWPNFDPGYGGSTGDNVLMPGFAHISGKYYLQASSWPYNPESKEITYHLFHMHGDAFTQVYSEVPQDLTVSHEGAITITANSFSVTADPGSLIALTRDGEVLGTGEGTGSPTTILIDPLVLPGFMTVTVTKANYYRYETEIPVIVEGPVAVVLHEYTVDDLAGGNGDGDIDIGETIDLPVAGKNYGTETAFGVTATISTTDPLVTITDDTETFGDIGSDAVVWSADDFDFEVSSLCEHGRTLPFTVTFEDNASNSWDYNLLLTVNAPVVLYDSHSLDDSAGNGDGIADPGETISFEVILMNSGGHLAENVSVILSTADSNCTFTQDTSAYPDIVPGFPGANLTPFQADIDAGAPIGHSVPVDFEIYRDANLVDSGQFSFVVSRIPVLLINLDPTLNSAPAIEAALTSLGIAYDVTTTWPSNFDLYSSLFICLGIYSNNTVLSTVQSNALVSFLQSGRNVYMEGGDCWYYDSSASIYADDFGISGLSDGTGDTGTIQGIAGTITEGMQFTYSGDNSWMDHLAALPGATLIFNNLSPLYGNGIAYDQGTYRTIGVSFEFGGLSDGPSGTKLQWMTAIVNYLLYPPHHIELRKGNVNTGLGDPADVFFLNGSTGNAVRKITVSYGTMITGTMQPSPAGPNPGNYTLYAWPGEAGQSNPADQPYDVGESCFPFPPSNGSPAPPPVTVANCMGYRWLLGVPAFPTAQPAPGTIFAYPYLAPGTYSLQGLIMDAGASSSQVTVSITNAIVLEINP